MSKGRGSLSEDSREGVMIPGKTGTTQQPISGKTTSSLQSRATPRGRATAPDSALTLGVKLVRRCRYNRIAIINVLGLLDLCLSIDYIDSLTSSYPFGAAAVQAGGGAMKAAATAPESRCVAPMTRTLGCCATFILVSAY